MPSKKATKPKAPSSPPAASLGDDVAAPPARAARGEPLNIIVARSHIVGGKVQLKVLPTGPLRGQRGQKVQVKHAYRLEEESTEKEEYRFLLRSRLGAQHHAPSLARHGDAYAIPEDVSGVLVHEYVLQGSGTQTLHFEIGAEYTVGDWKQTHVTSHDQKQAAGEVQIIVA